ncbi:MAG: hypothetical protein AB1584_15320 [Pseudomonadota bacterium]
MSFVSTLTQFSFPVLPLAELLRAALLLALLASVLMFFRPLLSGIARALMLTIRPRMTKEQRAARLAHKTGAVLQRAIDSAKGPGTGTLGSGA